jgi:hypothetical protein
MNFRKIVLAAATMAALSPALSYASPEKASVKACANALASSIAGSGAAIPGYKLAYRSSFGSTLADFYPTDYSFTLVAHDAKTGLPIASARCTTNSRGAVTAFTAIPTDKAAALAASF